MKIFKYPLELTDSQIIDMPKGAEILCVQNQRGNLCLWAEVNPEAAMTKRKIELHGTGNEIGLGDPGFYIGTAQWGDAFVWHIYDKGEQP